MPAAGDPFIPIIRVFLLGLHPRGHGYIRSRGRGTLSAEGGGGGWLHVQSAAGADSEALLVVLAEEGRRHGLDSQPVLELEAVHRLHPLPAQLAGGPSGCLRLHAGEEVVPGLENGRE